MGKILKQFKQDSINKLIEAVDDGANNSYFIFTSKSTPWPVEGNPPTEGDSVQTNVFDVRKELLFGKRVRTEDVSFVVPRATWTANTVYDRYDHRDQEIFEKDFYVVTTENNVYKCLDNAGRSESTEKPVLTQNTIFTTLDGYRWKYMFTIDSPTMTRFATPAFIPVTSNSSVGNSAVDGIDVIDIVSGGAGYTAYSNGVVQSVPNTTVFQLSDSASLNSDFYNNSSFYIYDGAAEGQLRVVADYIVNNSGRWARLNSPIIGAIPQSSKYLIGPQIKITGDGTGAQAVVTVNSAITSDSVFLISINNGGRLYSNGDALAFSNSGSTSAHGTVTTFANGTISDVTLTTGGTGYTEPPLVGVTSNTGTGADLTAVIGGFPITSIDVINHGSGYTYAGIEIISNNAFGGGASLAAIIAPPGGHGKDPVGELGAHHLAISTTFESAEANSFVSDTAYRVIGLMHNPRQEANNLATFTSNTFSQVVRVETLPIVAWDAGDRIVGEGGARAIVVSSNDSMLVLSGDHGFANVEPLTNLNTAEATVISKVISLGDLDPYSGDVLYIHNIVANQRIQDQSETIKLVVEY